MSPTPPPLTPPPPTCIYNETLSELHIHTATSTDRHIATSTDRSRLEFAVLIQVLFELPDPRVTKTANQHHINISVSSCPGVTWSHRLHQVSVFWRDRQNTCCTEQQAWQLGDQVLLSVQFAHICQSTMATLCSVSCSCQYINPQSVRAEGSHKMLA